MLNDKEKKIYQTIEKVVNGKIKRKEASFELGLSLRQIDRLKNIYLSEGEKGFIHKNRGKIKSSKKDVVLIEEIENLYLNEYNYFNLKHFYEDYIFGIYDISYDVMLKAFTNDDIISPYAHKKTIKSYREKMQNILKEIKENNDNNCNEKIELFKSRIIETEKAHVRKSINLYSFGQEIQMDACQKIWFGNTTAYLHLAVDRATKKVLFGWFEYEEITRGYFALLFNIIINYGIPAKIKADNRSSFAANNIKNTEIKHFFTQFGRICSELNIILETSSNPTSKANVERAHGTFERRLIAELKYNNITTIDEANEFLNTIFIPKMNKKFSYAINENKSVMKQNNYTEEELKLIISEKYTRIIDNASTISFNKMYYIPVDINTGEVITFMKGTKCTFIINYDGDYYSDIENHYYKMKVLENRDSTMIKESEIITTKKEHHIYHPPKNHPWRKNMMLR